MKLKQLHVNLNKTKITFYMMAKINTKNMNMVMKIVS